ncbi:sulfite exporter TauE/SafE family protein [Lentzea sp. HUAS12]|uniref:sulfite exporter TauE/SafE family protein n=1 Tax=Lentzea sp. HUAS12 TaxID=2951806 RepID=UPI0020A07C11|nr:sulfite exporter TauE/SafE family protein [Lentzea sp. HUAS12]USX54442.1 sulfite exporter TauE/SafE family protein [Lentzea sp. HUAS12]
MVVLTLLAAVLVGLALGVLGGGGSILTVPVLVYLAGQEPKQAIAMSLFVVGVTSAFGAVSHARAGRVRWRTGLVFGAAGMAGAYGGGRLAELVPGTWLLVGFAVMMIATAVAMLRGRREGGPVKPHGELPVPRVVAEGLVVGAVTGLVGAGGGFLVVPALALLGGLPMAVAVGTSLVVIAMKSFAGLAGYLATVHVDWTLTLLVAAAAVVGSLAGGRLTGLIPDTALRKGFGWFVLVMGGFVLAQELPVAVWVVPVLLLGGAGGAWLVGRVRQKADRGGGPE